ncbi:hypothetical protein, partial [Parabacteroides distasonis]|uniref:hypothetical protein n=1 Tax=Parabacteroides distasonis TaxID=823 RepID=UPI001C7D61B1
AVGLVSFCKDNTIFRHLLRPPEKSANPENQAVALKITAFLCLFGGFSLQIPLFSVFFVLSLQRHVNHECYNLYRMLQI